MTPAPTMLLRFVLRDKVTHRIGGSAVATSSRILQQFWAHSDGKDWAINKDDPVLSVNGTWRDVPWVSE